MPTTTNFGWTTPADTDLVKDGAAAIRTLGSGIDTSLVDLKGGTTGQILSKASNTDLDYTWINNDQGDITAVTAGTGLTGGGTTGAVTLTNDMATTITASGDIVVGTGSGTYDNLPIGTTGQVLTADTTVSPYKVKWATPASGGKVLQVVSTTAGNTSSSTSTFVDHITLSITPASASNKVLVLFHGGNAVKNGAGRGLTARVTRAGSAILEDICTVGGLSTTDDIRFGGIGCAYLDSPSATTSTEYKVQIRSFYNNASVSMNPNDDKSTLTLLEIAG